MSQDRVYIDLRVRKIIEKMENTDYLNTSTAKNRETFLYAASRGIDAPSSIEGKKEGFILLKDLTNFDDSIFYSMVVSQVGEDEVDKIGNKGYVYDLIQKCANTGFKIIEDEIDTQNFDNLDKKLLLDLEQKYKKLVEEGLLSENEV